jgi:hypothetical protein
VIFDKDRHKTVATDVLASMRFKVTPSSTILVTLSPESYKSRVSISGTWHLIFVGREEKTCLISFVCSLKLRWPPDFWKILVPLASPQTRLCLSSIKITNNVRRCF